jgi:hypothetical protein
MQEFVFTVTYDRDSDSITDVFVESPEVVMASLSCTVTDGDRRRAIEWSPRRTRTRSRASVFVQYGGHSGDGR